MKTFLILGDPLDPHAHYVAWALQTAGFGATFINSSHANVPTSATLYIDETVDAFTVADWSDAGAVWCRRLSPPLVHQNSSEVDEFSVREDRRFAKWLIQIIEGAPLRWINQPTAAQAAENKLVQLKVARSCGIVIPRTLVTAHPTPFRKFLAQEGVIVAKPLDTFSWTKDCGKTLSAFATVLDAERGANLSDEDVAQCVTIYQERIVKVADVRMIVMGKELFAYKVIQQGEQHFDYRIGFYQENHLTYEAIRVPGSLQKKMIDLMALLRIDFASADFALRADGEWVFLDLNPSGQWLFVEDGCPESHLGQRFCSFFTTGSVEADVQKQFPPLSDYWQSNAARAIKETLRDNSVSQAQSDIPVERATRTERESLRWNGGQCPAPVIAWPKAPH